ncbi:hypothetical protein [Sphingobacterium sp. LRF_L2]|uniref:hypothetical protein n=1 Tax=Sphingobacterium sp. LRF_L2 TaxID=3369421 RepID=UPI003F5F4DC2
MYKKDMYNRLLNWTYVAIMGLSLSSCDKDKVDVSIAAPLMEHELSNSRIVMFNQQYEQVVANGKMVTNIVRPYEGSEYFPDRGMYGGIWQAPVWEIPQELFEEGTIDFYMNKAIDNGDQNSLNFTVEEDNTVHLDHYIIPPLLDGSAEIVTTERSVASSSKPDHFKIRVLNLTRKVSNGNVIEDVSGPVTLAYADGSAVHKATTAIPVDNGGSEYIELPYGTYQFKLLTADGRQISGNNIENDNGDNLVISIDPATSRATTQTGAGSALLTYAPIKTYQPGGVYTLVVCPMQFGGTVQNGFVRIVDNIIPINSAYARVQAVNAHIGQLVSFYVNGEELQSNLAYNNYSAYKIVSTGDVKVEARAASGEIIASTTSHVDAGANVSAWLYTNTEGIAELKMVFNDLSGVAYRGINSDDAYYNKQTYDMPLAFRFLNLSADFEQVSFTMNDGKSLLTDNPFNLQYRGYTYAKDESAVYNLEPGKIPVKFPYVYFHFNSTTPFDLFVFRSNAGTIPGVWANDVPVFASSGFVDNAELYSQVGRTVPTYETGYYTLALIGRTGADVPAAEKAKVWKVKHNK